jgi:putative cardiolipin synthase
MDTRIGRGLAALPARPPGRSGVWALSTPIDAFATRVLMVRAADQPLDMQYYIWNADMTGLLMLDEIRQAAERGVHVRLLVDDNGVAGMDAHLAALDAHPQRRSAAVQSLRAAQGTRARRRWWISGA